MWALKEVIESCRDHSQIAALHHFIVLQLFYKKKKNPYRSLITLIALHFGTNCIPTMHDMEIDQEINST